MIPVTQTILTKENGGNCFAACLASIFELSLDEVPNAALLWRLPDDDAGERGHELIGAWLLGLGYAYVDSDVDEMHGWRPPGLWIGSYASPRLEGETHAVVCRGGEMLWDPHPAADRQPVDESTLRFVYWFVMVDPALTARELTIRSPSIATAVRAYLRPGG